MIGTLCPGTFASIRFPRSRPSALSQVSSEPLLPRPELAFVLPCRPRPEVEKTFKSALSFAACYILASELLVAAIKAVRPISRATRKNLTQKWPCACRGKDLGGDGVDAACAVLALNGLVLLSWQYSMSNCDKDAFKFMAKHFLHRPGNPLAYTVLTSAFSHSDPQHFFANASALAMFVPSVASIMGMRKFAYYYLAAAYASELLDHMIFSLLPPLAVMIGEKAYYELVSYVDRFITIDGKKKMLTKKYRWYAFQKRRSKTSLGASGVVAALMSYSFLQTPKLILSSTAPAGLNGLKPIHSVLIFIAEDLVRMHTGDNVGHGAHLGGYFWGVIIWIVEKLANGARWKEFCRRIQSFLKKTWMSDASGM